MRKPLLDELERLGYGGIVLDIAEQPLLVNQSALKILNAPAVCSDWRTATLNSILYNRGRLRYTLSEDWVVLPRNDSHPNRPVILRAVPLEHGKPAHSLLMLIDLGVSPRPPARSLQRIFGLSPSEARLAIAMAGGEGLEEIADATSVTIGTIRKQLASIFAKTDTHRQSELVALLTRLAILP